MSKSGNDANDGKSWATAKKTIQAAVNLCSDGDTVIVEAPAGNIKYKIIEIQKA